MNEGPTEKLTSLVPTLQLEPHLDPSPAAVMPSPAAFSPPPAAFSPPPAAQLPPPAAFSPPSAAQSPAAHSAPEVQGNTTIVDVAAVDPMRTITMPVGAPTVRLSSEEEHGLASTQAATPVSLPSAPSLRPRTVQLSIEQLLALFRPMPKPAARPNPSGAPAHAAAVKALSPARRMLLGGVAAALALGAISYAGTHALLVRNRRWVAPTVLSKSDPRVLQLAATLQQETARKSELALRKKDLEARGREATQWRELEAGFQASFMAALKNDLSAQRAELRRVQKLLADREAEGAAGAGPTGDRAELDAKLASIKLRVRLLEGALRGGRAGTYEGLALRREYDRSVLEAGKAREVEDSIAKSLADVDEQLKKKDTLLASIEASPYRLAVDQDVTLGFVPYDNAAAAKSGEALLACKTSLLFCDRVGEVGETLAGEVRGLHPVTGLEVRGQLVRVTLAPGRAVPDSVLYAGQAPLSL